MDINNKSNKKTMIPFALVNNKVKCIKEIGRLDEPVCLECGEKLILRNGDKNIKHLAHKSDSKCVYRESISNPNLETYEHKYAKEFLRDNLNYFRESESEIIIKEGEFKLGGYRDLEIEAIEIEYRGLKKELNLSREYIPDILIRTKDKLMALEIYVCNKKDPKLLKELLKNKNISVYEVDIRKMPELSVANIFKNMKLIFSNLKINFDNSIKYIQNTIIEKEKMIKDLEYQKNTLENQKEALIYDNRLLESEVGKLRNENRSFYLEINDLKKYLKNTEVHEKKELLDEVQALKEIIKRHEDVDIDNLNWQIGMQKYRIQLLLEQIDELRSEKK